MLTTIGTDGPTYAASEAVVVGYNRSMDMKRKKKITSILALAVAVVLSFSLGDRFRDFKWNQMLEASLADIRAEDDAVAKAQLRRL